MNASAGKRQFSMVTDEGVLEKLRDLALLNRESRTSYLTGLIEKEARDHAAELKRLRKLQVPKT